MQDNGGCSVFAVCKRTQPGRRQCVCRSGYYGDGLVCVGMFARLLFPVNYFSFLFPVCGLMERWKFCREKINTRENERENQFCVMCSGAVGFLLSFAEINPCLEGNGGCHANADCVHVGPNKVKTPPHNRNTGLFDLTVIGLNVCDPTDFLRLP